ncbi:MAG: hypothetical protein ACJ8CB_27085 [Ktedonobacteraceae bacterium]
MVALFGESIAEGKMSHNSVDALAQRMKREGYRFMNAGMAGDTAYQSSSFFLQKKGRGVATNQRF